MTDHDRPTGSVDRVCRSTGSRKASKGLGAYLDEKNLWDVDSGENVSILSRCSCGASGTDQVIVVEDDIERVAKGRLVCTCSRPRQTLAARWKHLMQEFIILFKETLAALKRASCCATKDYVRQDGVADDNKRRSEFCFCSLLWS